MKSDPTPEAIFGHGFADIIGEYRLGRNYPHGGSGLS